MNTRQNYSGAADYFRRAAAKGDRDGLTNLAVSYDNGWVEGHPPDKVWRTEGRAGHEVSSTLKIQSVVLPPPPSNFYFFFISLENLVLFPRGNLWVCLLPSSIFRIVYWYRSFQGGNTWIDFFFSDKCRWPLRTFTPSKCILWPIIDTILNTFS